MILNLNVQIDSCEDAEEHWDRLSPCPFCGHEDSPVLARSQRSCSDPTVSGYSRLPPIVSFHHYCKRVKYLGHIGTHVSKCYALWF